MKDPIERFIEDAEFLGVGKTREYDTYGGSWAVKRELYRANGRIVAVRRFPVHREQSVWESLFSTRPKEKIGEDYESQVISKDEAFQMLIDAGESMQRASELLDHASE